MYALIGSLYLLRANNMPAHAAVLVDYAVHQ